jgi:diacylglycerol kinase (ATP)
MRAAAIFGLGCSPKQLRPFRADAAVEWRMGMPASSDEADAVLVFGGDGTVHRHLASLVRLGLPVLVVPAGSGNDFARALGIRGVRDSVAAWERFRKGLGLVRAIDLGVITSFGSAGESPSLHKYFCCVAGVGLDAEVMQRANRLPRWVRGHGGYVLSLLPAIFQFAPVPVRILTRPDAENSDWTVRSDSVTTLAAFANTPLYGDGMKIAPEAKMDDGLIDICVVGAVDRFRLLRLFPTVYGGQHLKIAEVSYSQAERVRVESERPLDIYADGEFVCRTPVEIGVQRASLRVIVPSQN